MFARSASGYLKGENMAKQDLKVYKACRKGNAPVLQLAMNAFDALDEQIAAIAVMSASGELVIPSCSFTISSLGRSHVSDPIVSDRDGNDSRVCSGGDAMRAATSALPRDARLRDLLPGRIEPGNLPQRQQIRDRGRIGIEHSVDVLMTEISLMRGDRK